MRRALYLSILGLVVVAGCKHKCCRSDGTAPPAFLPPGPGSTIPPTNVPITPGAAPTLPPPDLRPSTSGRPAPEILLPDPLGPGGTSNKKSNNGAPGAAVTSPSSPMVTLEPPIAPKAEKPAAAPSNGLANFTQIKPGVATGAKPTIDGFDQLKKESYKTVVFLHAPGADVSAVRDMAESRSLALVAIETTPEKIGDAFEQVKKLASEESSQPMYVFDDDNTRSGAVWYLYFKTVTLENAEVSKIRARPLGLGDESEFWVEIKKYLAK